MQWPKEKDRRSTNHYTENKVVYFFYFRLEIYGPYFIAQHETKSRKNNMVDLT